MSKIIFFLWIVSSTGIPTMNTFHPYDSKSICENEIRRLELNYYRDRLPHRPDVNGERYYMACMTNKEVIQRLNETAIDKTIGE